MDEVKTAEKVEIAFGTVVPADYESKYVEEDTLYDYECRLKAAAWDELFSNLPDDSRLIVRNRPQITWETEFMTGERYGRIYCRLYTIDGKDLNFDSDRVEMGPV